MTRRAGMLLNFKCCICGSVEKATGGNKKYKCVNCRPIAFDKGGAFAMGQVFTAIRNNVLIHPSKLSCLDCGKQAAQYDHRDYNKPIKVEPVCRGCNLRRGPAIPIHGAIEKMIAQGRVPYRLNRRACQLFARLGRDTSVFLTLPKTLSNFHWQAIWPEFIPVVQVAIPHITKD